MSNYVRSENNFITATLRNGKLAKINYIIKYILIAIIIYNALLGRAQKNVYTKMLALKIAKKRSKLLVFFKSCKFGAFLCIECPFPQNNFIGG